MLRLIIFLILIFKLVCFSLYAQDNKKSNINIDFGIKTGYAQSYYNAAGESFNTKIQHGLGVHYFARALFYQHVSLEFELAGFYYLSKSDNKGDYYYPERMVIPWSVMVKGYLPVSFGYVNGGAGYYFPYIMKASYYYPREINPGLTAEIGCDFKLKKSKFLIGPLVKYVYYFDDLSDKYFSLYFLLNLSYRIF